MFFVGDGQNTDPQPVNNGTNGFPKWSTPKKYYFQTTTIDVFKDGASNNEAFLPADDCARKVDVTKGN